MQHAHKDSKNISGGSALELAVRIGEGREVAEAQSIARLFCEITHRPSSLIYTTVCCSSNYYLKNNNTKGGGI